VKLETPLLYNLTFFVLLDHEAELWSHDNDMVWWRRRGVVAAAAVAAAAAVWRCGQPAMSVEDDVEVFGLCAQIMPSGCIPLYHFLRRESSRQALVVAPFWFSLVCPPPFSATTRRKGHRQTFSLSVVVYSMVCTTALPSTGGASSRGSISSTTTTNQLSPCTRSYE